MASTQQQTNTTPYSVAGKGKEVYKLGSDATPENNADSGNGANNLNTTSADFVKQDIGTSKGPTPPIIATSTQPETQEGANIGASNEPTHHAPLTRAQPDTNSHRERRGRERNGTLLPVLESTAETETNAPPNAGKQRETPELRAEPKEKTQVVVAGLPTGWAAMAKTIKDVDEDKVKDYKDDIDTLLVFTGLFSAVLSAFVIVSFQMLSPDKQDAVIQYLAQISNQTKGYTITPSTVNSTAFPFQSLPPFQPSLVALRVNYLWFASLILTLVTASFAILVKQWLKEFLAYEYTSPHERLRARQFRYDALDTWKVYVIAGILPLLLQLALGLFFIGLCFFTQSDLHGIGNMCAVLVVLWLWFFVAAIVAPVFSPQCPYKTSLLKSPMIFLRCCCRYIKFKFANDIARPQSSIRSTFLNPLRSIRTHFISILSQRLNSIREHFKRYDLMAGEESEAVKMETSEVDLLTQVDGLLLDDELLGTTILDALTQSHVKSTEVINFVVKAITYRFKGNTLTRPLLFPPDLKRLTKRARSALSDIVADCLKIEQTVPSNTDDQDALCILLSTAELPLTSKVRRAVCEFIPSAALHPIAYALAALSNGGRLGDSQGIIVNRLVKLFEVESLEAEAALYMDNSFSNILAYADMAAFPDLVKVITSLLSRSDTQRAGYFSSSILGTMIISFLQPDRKLEETVLWLESAITILISLPNFRLAPVGKTALTSLCQDISLLDSVSSSAQALISRSQGCEIDLRVLEALDSNSLEAIIEQCVQAHSAEEIGPWLDNSIHTLLSRPSFKLAPAGALLKLIPVAPLYDRLCRCIWGLIDKSPGCELDLHVLEALDSDTLEATIKQCVQDHSAEEIGPWLDDSIRTLLSRPSFKLAPAGALLKLIPVAPLYDRLCRCIWGLIDKSPGCELDLHVLEALDSDTLEATIKQCVQAHSAEHIGPWLDDSIRTLLSRPSFKLAPAGALLKLLPVAPLYDRLCRCIWGLIDEAPGRELNSVVIRALKPDTLGVMINTYLVPELNGQVIGLWLEDAVTALLSQTFSELTPACRTALASLHTVAELRRRLCSCIQQLVSNNVGSNEFLRMLSLLHDLSQDRNEHVSAEGLFGEVVDMVVRTHPMATLGPWLSNDGPDHDVCRGHFVSVLAKHRHGHQYRMTEDQPTLDTGGS